MHVVSVAKVGALLMHSKNRHWQEKKKTGKGGTFLQLSRTSMMELFSENSEEPNV